MIDPQDLMFRALCAAAQQIGWHPIRPDHPALEAYGEDGRELARRINRLCVRLYLAGEPGFESFAQLIDADPAGDADVVAMATAALGKARKAESHATDQPATATHQHSAEKVPMPARALRTRGATAKRGREAGATETPGIDQPTTMRPGGAHGDHSEDQSTR